MNLGELASFVCNKVRHPDSASVTICKQFLNARYRMIWDGSLWRDSLFLFDAVMDPTTPQGNAGILQLICSTADSKTTFDKIVMMRSQIQQPTGSMPMGGENIETLMQEDLDQFTQTGTAFKFVLLPPACWDFGTMTTAYYPTVVGTNPPTLTCAAKADNSADEGVTVNVRTKYSTNIGNFQLTASIAPAYNSIGGVILTVTKPVTTGIVYLWIGPSGSELILTMAATDTALQVLPRIRVFQIPTTETTFNILAKKRAVSLTLDNEVYDLDGIDATLCAYAQGDMLERERQYTKARLCYQEGASLLEQLKYREVWEQANRPRIIPTPSDTGWPYGWVNKGDFLA